ncbi:Zn(II)2Cys6 transcription factor [Aspergillus undulatus]|uniref:Zn(II)2Cys6 transcription factor n=1 Tax=Aspergillus undulatus TaxID=1810928 RepID=UPI003CCCA08B
MESPSVIRRRMRRRVADENRKRAPRACVRCKRRKSRCIGIQEGACQSCRQTSSACIFRGQSATLVEKETAGAEDTQVPDVEVTSSVTQSMNQLSPSQVVQPIVGVDSQVVDPARKHFLSRLRETFSLDPAPDQMIQAAKPAPTQSAEAYRLKKAADSFPPRHIADFLLSVCIQHGTDSFFYFDQAEFLAEIEDFYTNPASNLRTDTSFLCLAHATFALGSQWTTLVPRRNMGPSLVPEDGDPGRIFYNQAKQLIPDLIDLPTLRSVQAPYVLGVYLLPASAIDSAYVYLGLAIRKALAMNLHLNGDDRDLSPRDIEIRRRLWWAIYSLDRSSTAKLGRPRSVHPNIITVSLPRRLPELDNSQRFNNIDYQIADAQLMLILDRIAETSEWANEKTSPYHFTDQLKGWKRSLHPTFRLDNILPHMSEYRATLHLYLNYYHCFIAMGKVSVVSIVQAQLRHRFGRDKKAPQIQDHVDFSAKRCIKAARKILTLFESLYRTGNLTKFSFTDYQGCSIATVVLLLARILERDPVDDRRVEFGLDCLRKMAEGNQAAKMGVKFVEALKSLTNEAIDKLNRTRPSPFARDSEHTITDQYEDWTIWLAQRQEREANRRDVEDEQALDKHTAHVDFAPAAEMPQLWTPVSSVPRATLDPTPSHVIETQNLLSTMYSDDQTFLMGLTGLDIFTLPDFAESGDLCMV